MKYVFLFLISSTIILLTEGCAVVKFLNDPVKGVTELIWGKPKKKTAVYWSKDELPENMDPEELKNRRLWCGTFSQPTVIEKFRSLLGLGATAGGSILGVSLLILLFGKNLPIEKKWPAMGIGVGFVLILLSILLDKYLMAILIVTIIIGAVVALVLIRKHWARLKKWVDFTDATISKGHLTTEDIDEAAIGAIGEKGSKDREAIKSIMNSSRT